MIEWNNFIRDALNEKDDFNYAAKKLGDELDKEVSFVPSWLNHQQAELFVRGYLNYFQKLREKEAE